MRSLVLVLVVGALAGCSAGSTTDMVAAPDLRMQMVPGPCMNGFTDADETDQDCGGPTCSPCDTGQACKVGHDCQSGICINKVCAAPACGDGVKNGTESDVDCGASCPERCALGRKCNDGQDCESATCINGLCGKPPCTNGFKDGTESDIDCGGADCPRCPDGKRCNDGADCAGGTCVNQICHTPCPAGHADCDGNSMNGCEVETASDLKNCGACGNTCAAPAHGASTCVLGMCGLGACDTGFADCDRRPETGCEIDLMQSLAHCGGCGKACSVPNGSPACTAGACVVASCRMGFADCDGMPGNGCEASILSDPNNCNGCNLFCLGARSMQACQVGKCVIASCSPGYSDCDQRADTGCEIASDTDARNCGACGNVCPAPDQAVAGCLGGQCGIGQCKAPFADCDKMAANGCETDLSTPMNCGACGMACKSPPNATAGCKNGICGVGVCSALFGDCDGNPANGCEKDLSGDVGNCGKCSAICNLASATSICQNGQCGVLQCQQGFGDCDKMPANGCEASFAIDPNNCGQCGNACGKGFLCAAAVCVQSKKVLVLAADNTANNYNDIVTKLKATNAFTSVDALDASVATPSVNALNAYDMILVYAWDKFKDSVAVGDNLATYFEGGGTVVVAAFGQDGVAGGLTGKFANNYMMFTARGGAFGVGVALGQISEPNSPLVSGVAKLNISVHLHTPMPRNGAVVVASWNDASALVVRGVANGRNRVDLNLWPVSQAGNQSGWSGDGTTLIKNALLYR